MIKPSRIPQERFGGGAPAEKPALSGYEEAAEGARRRERSRKQGVLRELSGEKGPRAPSSSGCGTQGRGETQGKGWDKGESREELGGSGVEGPEDAGRLLLTFHELTSPD